MAIAVATTTLAPGYRIFPMLHGGIPLWVLTLVFVALDYALIAGHGAGVGVAHLTGGLLGFLYMRAMNRGLDLGAWMHQVNDWFLGLFDPRKHQARHEAIRREMFYKAGPPPFKATPKRDFSQQRIDEILDKINQKGFQHLSDEEKEYLKRASKEEL
jgi:hypothetical protein